ncbi:hypothetical protein M2155_000675 [Streptomyces sp. SAI-119]|uniref:hypothetical protein n=1 Tax=Streptomyces sp. SAI-119 TaxID=2940541 RepID=UPI0024737883|nr:hypothetical protein [Streptomyces sp. SAI-119]MDH6448267.1 hypothetical protein [Streptomyces sp. SAI-119]
MTAPSRLLAALDTPLPVVVAQLTAVATLDAACVRTKSPSDQLAYRLDGYLVTHPDAPVSVDRDYPQWAAALAAQPTYFRREAS